MNSGAYRKWLFVLIFFSILLDEFKALQNLVHGLIFNINCVDTILVEDHNMMILIRIIDSNDITLRSWNSTGVEQVFVS